MPPDAAAYNAAYGICALALLILSAYKLRDLLRFPSDLAGRFVATSIASTAAAFSIAAPSVYTRLDSAIGVPNAATLAVYACILTTSALFQAVLVLWSAPAQEPGPHRRVVAWLIGYALVTAVMTALFAAGHTADGEHPIDFDAHYAAAPFISEFLLIYYTAFAVGMAQVARLAHRYASSAGRPWLIRGLHWIWIGALFALGYCLLKTLSVIGIMLGWNLQEFSTLWAPASASIGALLIGAGLTVPAWGPRLTTWAHAGWRFRAYGQLYPLWHAMYEATPEIALDPARSRSRWAIRDLKHRLYRRAIEIRDGRLSLSAYLRPAPENTSQSHGGKSRPSSGGMEARAEAAMIAQALHAKSGGSAVAAGSHHLAADKHGGDLAAELRWLVLVSQEYARLTRRFPRKA